MPRKTTDLPARIVEVLDHLGDMPAEANAPIDHYILASNSSGNMRRYIMQKLENTGHYPAVRDRHFITLNNMVLVSERLADILTIILGSDPTLFAPQDEANAISRKFGFPLTVAGAVGLP